MCANIDVPITAVWAGFTCLLGGGLSNFPPALQEVIYFKDMIKS